MSQLVKCDCGQVVAARAIVDHLRRYCPKRIGGYVPPPQDEPSAEQVARALDVAEGIRNRR